MNFLIVSNAPTFSSAENIHSAYAPYVKEMEIWFKYVDQVTIVSPGAYPEKVFTESFKFQNIRHIKVPFLSFKTLGGSLLALFKLPFLILTMLREFRNAEHIHFRCPGNLGFIGCVLQIFFPSKPKTAKYAGNWDPLSKQPISYRIQRWLLSNTLLTRNMKVLVYGKWPNQSSNVVPFFTASFSENDIGNIEIKNYNPPFYFLFVGSLVQGKQPWLALEVIKGLRNKGFEVILDYYGEGREEDSLKKRCCEEGLDEIVHFNGNCSMHILQEAYQKAHFLILPSLSEGWPKVVAEAMFYGCIPIATPVSCVPWMLDKGRRGILDAFLRNPENKELLVTERIESLLQDETTLQRMSEAAKEWAWIYTVEKFELSISDVLKEKKALEFITEDQWK